MLCSVGSGLHDIVQGHESHFIVVIDVVGEHGVVEIPIVVGFHPGLVTNVLHLVPGGEVAIELLVIAHLEFKGVEVSGQPESRIVVAVDESCPCIHRVHVVDVPAGVEAYLFQAGDHDAAVQPLQAVVTATLVHLRSDQPPSRTPERCRGSTSCPCLPR